MSQGIAITGYQTWFAKVLLPAALVGVFALVFAYGDLSVYSNMLGVAATWAIAAVLFVGFGALCVAASRQLRTLRLIGDEVEIGGFLERVRVPLREVNALDVLTTLRLQGRNPVRLTVERPTPFLDSVVFLPRSYRALFTLQTAWAEARGHAPPAEDALGDLMLAGYQWRWTTERVVLPRRRKHPPSGKDSY